MLNPAKDLPPGRFFFCPVVSRLRRRTGTRQARRV